MLLVPVAGVVVAGGAGAFALAVRLERRRWEALAALAAARGWALCDRDETLPDAFEGYPFGRGTGRRAENVLRGRHRGRGVALFEYSWRTHTTDGQGGRQTQVHRAAVVAVDLPAAVPRIELQPATVLSRLVPWGEIDLESEDFNRRYRLTADDPRLAYDVLSPRTVARLLDAPPLALRLSATSAVSWQPGRFERAEALARLDLVCDVLDRVPSWVWA